MRWRRGRAGREGSDRGAGSIWVLAFGAVVWSAATAAMAVGGVRAARHRADAAADLAALAAARYAADGGAAACRKASVIATGSGGRVSACGVCGMVAEVSVAVLLEAPFGIGGLRVVSRARAGPAGPESVRWHPHDRCTQRQ
ncbi:Rv3654c family TadE-like protein [Spirillospora sp. NBC_01491]|uniref:Rv3654c family TadE-like protein n=1 Tax=Spirillospora sp. NBC_01491 TaxID=2976007 RepID=UPI003FA71292